LHAPNRGCTSIRLPPTFSFSFAQLAAPGHAGSGGRTRDRRLRTPPLFDSANANRCKKLPASNGRPNAVPIDFLRFTPWPSSDCDDRRESFAANSRQHNAAGASGTVTWASGEDSSPQCCRPVGSFATVLATLPSRDGGGSRANRPFGPLPRPCGNQRMSVTPAFLGDPLPSSSAEFLAAGLTVSRYLWNARRLCRHDIRLNICIKH
jgi:hypothetical protein